MYRAISPTMTHDLLHWRIEVPLLGGGTSIAFDGREAFAGARSG
jgi:hypothetical protein